MPSPVSIFKDLQGEKIFGQGIHKTWSLQAQEKMTNKSWFSKKTHHLDVPGRKLGSMVRINGLFHLLVNGVYWGYNPLILTIDPNFQQDIQADSPGLKGLETGCFPPFQPSWFGIQKVFFGGICDRSLEGTGMSCWYLGSMDYFTRIKVGCKICKSPNPKNPLVCPKRNPGWKPRSIPILRMGFVQPEKILWTI